MDGWMDGRIDESETSHKQEREALKEPVIVEMGKWFTRLSTPHHFTFQNVPAPTQELAAATRSVFPCPVQKARSMSENR